MNILIIGAGSIGLRHLEILSKNEDVNRIELVTRRELPEFKTFKSLKNVISLNDYDYFVISSETNQHFDQLLFLEERLTGKTILVEKPLFHEMKALGIKNNNVFVAYNLRFHPAFLQIKKWLEEETVISVNAIVGQYLPSWRPGIDYRTSYSSSANKGGGVLLDLSHEIDYLQWLFGELVSLNAISKKISTLEIESDDYLSLIGKTKNGVYINLNMDYLSRIPIRQIVIQTNTLTIKADLINGKIEKKKDGSDPENTSFSDLGRNSTYCFMHEAALNKNDDRLCSYMEGLATMSVIEKIREFSVKERI